MLGVRDEAERCPADHALDEAALDVLGLKRLDVVHAGRSTWALDDRIRALALRRILTDLQPLA